MGKKGKNKNQAANNQNAPKLESENVDKELKIQEVVTEVPKVGPLKDEPVIVETLPLDGNESKEGTLKSKKRRNRKKKNTATEVNIEDLKAEKNENVNQKEELPSENQMQSDPNEENAIAEPSTDTLKKKRRRNRKKNVTNVGEVQNESVNQLTENKTPVEISSEKSGEDIATSQQNTLKRKRNRNKNKTAVNKDKNESIVEAIEKPLEKDLSQKVEVKVDQTEKPEPQKRGKKQKRFDLSSKKTILDELQERQEREQNEARDHIKKEIAKREKLLETIDLVLDCHKTEVELAKNQQESLKDVKFLSQEAAKSRPLPSSSSSSSSSKPSKQSANKKSTPVEEELVNKIEQVLGMTKLEIKNAQTQQAYVNRLEAEVAKVKQSKDILLGTQSSSVVPVHIQKMAKEMKDISKGEVPKTKEELIKEIESRDVLMSEINRVLDTTKSEIDKVQKQQKIIQNLEVELNKMKEQEVVEKLMLLAEEEEKFNEPPPPPKQSAATASLLDALMANVGKLKEIQAMKEKQKTEQTQSDEGSVETMTQAAVSESSIQKLEKPDDVETKVENKSETLSVAQKEGKEEISKSPQKDAKNISNEKKLASPKEGSPKQQKKHPKDQKKEPQKVHETKSKAEEMINSENKKKDEDLTKIDSLKENHSTEVKKEQPIKENIIEVSEMKVPENLNECKLKIDDVKQDPVKQEKPESPKKDQKKKDHNKDKGKNDKEVKNVEINKTAETNNSNQPKKTTVSQKETITPDQNKIESIDSKNDEKLKNVMPVEVKPITSTETVSQEMSKNMKANDQKKNDKEHKTSPRNSNKNKHHNKHEKKDKGVPEVITPVVPVTGQKLSMADMLKNAPDPPPEEIIKKPIEDAKIEAPLARSESVIIEVKPSEQIKEMMQPTTKETSEQKEVAKALDVDETVKISSEVQEDEIVIVNKEQVEAEIKEEKLNEQDLSDPKNVQRGGFVSPVDSNDAKPLKKDEKQNANKNKSPIKTPPKPTLQKGLDAKAPPNKSMNQKPKLEVQAKINSKSMDVKKTPQSPTKQLSPTTEKNQPKFESATNVLIDTPSSPKIETQNLCHDILPSSTDKPKVVPPRPDVTKTSNTKPASKAGNVTNQSTSSIKTKTPSVSKPATTSTAQSHAAKPKPTVSQTRQSATSKPPINTKSTNQKPLATPQKVNSTKTATPKPSSSMASATETK